MLNGITRHPLRALLAVAVSSTALLGAAAPAHADRDDRRVIVTGGVYVGKGYDRCGTPPYRPAVHRHGDSCGCGDCCAQREYARGVNRGEAAGWNQGFRDGINGKAFCADVRDPVACESRAYRDGYFAAFGSSYRAGFNQGRAERNRACAPRPVYRPRHGC